MAGILMMVGQTFLSDNNNQIIGTGNNTDGMDLQYNRLKCGGDYDCKFPATDKPHPLCLMYYESNLWLLINPEPSVFLLGKNGVCLW